MIFIANQETGSIHAIRRDDPVSRPTTEKDKYGNEILKLDNGEIQFKTVRFQYVLQEKQITQDRERLEESRDWIKEQLERTQSSNLSREAKERTKKTLAEE